MRRPLDPRIVNVCIDSNALQPPATDPVAVEKFIALHESGVIQIVVPSGVRIEAIHPSAPPDIRAEYTSSIFTLPTNPTESEWHLRNAIEVELRGNAKADKHAADAAHLAEACKYAGYFITHDTRVLKRAGKLANLLPPSLQVVTLSDFLSIYDEYARGDQ